jgi:hypothetical protein
VKEIEVFGITEQRALPNNTHWRLSHRTGLSLREPPSLFFSNGRALKRVRPLQGKCTKKLKARKLQESALWKNERLSSHRPGNRAVRAATARFECPIRLNNHGLKNVLRTLSRWKYENAMVCPSGEESREK